MLDPSGRAARAYSVSTTRFTKPPVCADASSGVLDSFCARFTVHRLWQANDFACLCRGGDLPAKFTRYPDDFLDELGIGASILTWAYEGVVLHADAHMSACGNDRG